MAHAVGGDPLPPLSRIQQAADTDDINFDVLPFSQEALASIANLSLEAAVNTSTIASLDFSAAYRIDTHTHPIPKWFRALEPQAAGRATPSWDVFSHLKFMSEHHIAHSVLCISTPQANAFLSDVEGLRKQKTIALARLLNEFVAELCRNYPKRFSWMAILPLPHVDAAITEAQYALNVLGAAGVGVLTNHESLYPGHASFDPLWQYLQDRTVQSDREVVFIHPTEPLLKLPTGQFINTNPSPLRSGLGEFYFETARAISSITANSTILKFPNLHWRISHGAGAFPDISERFLLGFPDIAEQARQVYRERFWYDSAGPVFPKQIRGLTKGVGVGIGRLVFGTDYPYGIGFWDVDANIAGLADAEEDFTPSERRIIFQYNTQALFGKKIEKGQKSAEDHSGE